MSRHVLFPTPHAPVAVARHVTFEGDIVPDDGRFDGDQTIARRYFPVMLQPTRHLRVRLVPEIEINGMDCKSARRQDAGRSEEHTSELQSLMRNSYAVFCLKKQIHY